MAILDGVHQECFAIAAPAETFPNLTSQALQCYLFDGLFGPCKSSYAQLVH